MRQREQRGVVQREQFVGVIGEFQHGHMADDARNDLLVSPEQVNQGDVRGENERDELEPFGARPAFARFCGIRPGEPDGMCRGLVHGWPGVLTMRGSVASSALWMPVPRASRVRWTSFS